MAEETLEILPKEDIIPNSVDSVVFTEGKVKSSTALLDFDIKFTKLKQVLTHNKDGCDLKWNTFVAACQNYKVTSLLHPFPPMFVKNDGVSDIPDLVEFVESIPSLHSLLDMLHSIQSSIEMNQRLKKCIDLLHWVFLEQNPTLEPVSKSQMIDILDLVKSESPFAKPNFIFKVNYDSLADTRWQQLKENRKSIYAYHGSRLENFYSILHFGLQQHLNKNSLFGQGIYLTSELCMSLIYSPFGLGWNKSGLGSELSLVALCEIIDDVDGVKCQVKDADRSRALAQDSMGGEVPHKYYVVVNSSLVKLRYLLVYSKKSSIPTVKRVNESRILTWIRKHRLVSFVFLYCLLLVCIGFSDHVTFRRLYKNFVNRFYKMVYELPVIGEVLENWLDND